MLYGKEGYRNERQNVKRSTNLWMTNMEKFFLDNIVRCRYEEVYHHALIYCLGISETTRRNIDSIYDFATGCIKTECLCEDWQTSGSIRIVRLAFCLYCDGTPSVNDMEDVDSKLAECREYTVGQISAANMLNIFGSD